MIGSLSGMHHLQTLEDLRVLKCATSKGIFIKEKNYKRNFQKKREEISSKPEDLWQTRLWPVCHVVPVLQGLLLLSQKPA